MQLCNYKTGKENIMLNTILNYLQIKLITAVYGKHEIYFWFIYNYQMHYPIVVSLLILFKKRFFFSVA